MTYKAFIQKYNGKKVDFDGAFGAQCVDLFRQFCADVLSIPHTGAVEGAKDLFLNYEKMPKEKLHFSRVRETKSAKYRAGDVAVWNATATNRYGHVALVVAPFGDSLVVFEQDGFRQDGAKIALRERTNLLGILRSVKEVA